MQADEKEIVDYLKGWSKNYVSGKEIARKVGGKNRYEKDRGWAIPVLARMVRHGVLETDYMGYFRLRQEDEKDRARQYLSPQMLKLLKNSGKSFTSFVIDEDEDDALPTIRPAPFGKAADSSGKAADDSGTPPDDSDPPQS